MTARSLLNTSFVLYCQLHTVTRLREPVLTASIAVGLDFLRCEGASPPAPTRSRKTHVAHRRIKIERVYRPYLTATEAAV
jgi:hypothetical protein